MTPDEIARLRSLAEAATPGPWDQPAGKRWRVYAGDVLVAVANGVTHAAGEVNGDYIAAAHPQVVLALLDRIAELEATLETHRRGLAKFHELQDRIRNLGMARE